MKHVLRCIPYALVLSVAVLFAACSKDGAAGPAGPAGNPGPAGPKGDPGAPGSANVIYSTWLDVQYGVAETQTRPDGTIDTTLFAAGIPMPKVDSIMLGHALVNVYVNLGTALRPNIVVLPYIDESGVMIRYLASSKLLTLVSNVNAGTANTTAGKRLQYRYVVVPGGVAARAANSIDWKKYTEVQQYLHLED
ncbi:hypothetical protein [Chitinophaga solisilvae]|uniref:Uncharacterized protein n=1 Tax=Chitinophaga solisilvae TaxID=1233460 RepID=A0A433WFV8_9BACT|nr:hypothetical protein [Chitinophaga solisilvae]NSL90398.1 hypothetical protein [Chitinophaga solisilvae]